VAADISRPGGGDLYEHDRRRGSGLGRGLVQGLARQGPDARPHCVIWHLQHHQIRVSPATISGYLAGHGLVAPELSNRPRCSCLRFAAELANECWRADVTPLVAG